jgi:hypothetical protein
MDPLKPNKRLDDDISNPNIIFVKSKFDTIEDNHSNPVILPGFNPSQLIGRSFLDLPEEDGQ